MNKNQTDGPNQLDFSKAAARRAALSDTIQHPATIFPLVVGVAAGIGLTTFSIVSAPMAIGIATGGALAGLANWVYRFFGKGDVYEQRYLDKFHEEFEALKERKLATIGSDLKKLGCAEGRRQVQEFEDKFQNLSTVLRRVLSESELTFSRFQGTVELVYKSGIDNLERAVTILTNISDIDREDLGNRIDRLAGARIKRAADTTTLATLQARAKLYDDGQEEVASLLARNEEALTAIDQAGVSVGKVKISNGDSDNLKLAMEELTSLIQRVNSRAAAVPLALPEEK
jgi:hypothetical protein